MMLTHFILALSLILGMVPAHAAIYYVATNGHDTKGSGSEEEPWRTIRYGMEQMAAGDTLYLRGGVYEEARIGSKVLKSGISESRRTVIASYPGERAIFRPPVLGGQHAFAPGTASNVTLDGWTIDCINKPINTTIGGGVAISLKGKRENFTLTNMHFINNPVGNLMSLWGDGSEANNNVRVASNIVVTSCLFSNLNFGTKANLGHGMYVGRIINSVFENNVIVGGRKIGIQMSNHNSSGDNWATNVIVRNNYIGDGFTSGIYFGNTVDSMIYNNVIATGMVDGSGVGGIRLDAGNIGVKVFNNTVAIQHGGGRYGIRVRGDGGHHQIVNNIFLGANSSDMRLDTTSRPTYWTNNIGRNRSGTWTAAVESGQLIGSSYVSNFVAPPQDLRLSANSPARNAGVDLSAYFAADHDGYTRGRSGRWDIGAFEHRQQVIIDLQASSGALQAPMTVTSESLASQSLGQSGQPTHVSSPVAGSGSVTFQFEAPSAGDYVIWCHMLAPSGWIDSVSVSVNDGEPDLYFPTEGADFDTWSWSRVNGERTGAPYGIRLFQLHQGINTIRFATVVPYVGLSRIVVTDDLEFLPDDGVPVRPQPPTVSIERIGTSTILGWPSVPDKYYHIFYKHNLSDVHWLRLNPRNVYRANGTWVELVDKNTAAGRFYAVYAAP